MPTSQKEKQERCLKIYEILLKVYPDARPLLNYRNAFELLISTILAAQCTDERVNKITPLLFAKYPTSRHMLCASQTELEEIIRPTGFFRHKASNIKRLCFTLAEKYNEKIPETMEELVQLPGVGRKTANVILGHCFGQPAIVVDTHFLRLMHRLALSEKSDPARLEADLKELVPSPIQTKFSDVLNWHGRFRCKARKPDCPHCEIKGLCPYQPKTLD